MPLIQDSHDSLPYIDAPIPPEIRSRIEALLFSELTPDHATNIHPLLPIHPSPNFSPLIAAELDRIAAKQSLSAIDIARYEALEAPPPTSPSSDETQPQLIEAWRSTLQKAYTSSTYLNTRVQNLGLLEEYGKNAWLVGNSQLEEILKGIEKELVETRDALESIAGERREVQENVRGELEGLDEGWRKGIGKLVEVQVAAEDIRRQILERRREGAT